ncbi:unnamed protein product [Rotaria sordida]|uniref:PiggyBac transposable element-derived protein domain-containing protein n=1 Tax=Rotaria sordida TaxID=392033 RepID=A0A814AJW0_9BILA|nr:unnamed protein product [Rotaria sordida]
MDDNWLDGRSDDSDNAHVEESGSETENIDSETTENEEEIDLEKLNLEESDPDENYTQGCSYSSRSDMVLSSTPSYSSTTKHHANVNLTSGLTELTAHVASVEDAFLCFISEEMLKKILLYSNTAGISNRTLDDSFEEISMVELKGFIGLLLISGLLGKSRKKLRISLVAHLLDVRLQTSKFLHKDVQSALAVMGYPKVEKTSQELNETSTDLKTK